VPIEINRDTAGIPGQYKEVDASVLYNQYYRLADSDADSDADTNDTYTDVTDPSTPDTVTHKKKRKHDEFLDEDVDGDGGGWTPSGVGKERVPEQSLSQALEEGEAEVVWKRPKMGGSKRGRRKKVGL